ncbi:hypothetical protein ACSQ6I_27455 [Anabaena sp. WFMT]
MNWYQRRWSISQIYKAAELSH